MSKGRKVYIYLRFVTNYLDFKVSVYDVIKKCTRLLMKVQRSHLETNHVEDRSKIGKTGK